MARDEFDLIFSEPVEGAVEPTQTPISAPVAAQTPQLEVKIDLEDGSGVQVFKGATQQELIDKLADAQKHATIKIRELNQLVSQPQAPVEPPQQIPDFSMQPQQRQMTPEEEYFLAQEFSTGKNPLGAFRAMTEATFGVPPEQISQYLAAARQRDAYQAVEASVEEFRTVHADEYYPCDKNYNLMVGMLQRANLPPTSANLDWAFTRLNKSGLLEPIPADETNATPASSAGAQQTSKRVPKGGLSDRGASQGTPPSKGLDGLTVEDMYNMNTDELKSRIERQFPRTR